MKKDKIICGSCGKLYKNTNRNDSTSCKSCRRKSLRKTAEILLRNVRERIR